jgi:hypothetical protein
MLLARNRRKLGARRGKDYDLDDGFCDDGLDDYGIDDGVDGEGELRYEMQWGRS